MTEPEGGPYPTRREALLGAPTAAALATLVLPAAAAATTAASSYGNRRWTSEFLSFDPVQHLRHSMRLQRSMLDEDDILHWYHFIMFSVPVGKSPQPVVRWEGIELSRHRKLAENVYRLHGHNLSFPRDLNTGKFTDRVINPVTGATVNPKPITLTNDPGYILSLKGILPLDNPGGEPRPKYGMIRREGNIVKIDAMRVAPASWPATFVETSYEAAPADLFNDPKQLWLPTDVSGGYVFPYPDWMEMGKAPGHMFASVSGYKLRSVAQLPDEFRKRAEKEFPELLRVDVKQFDRPFALPNIGHDQSEAILMH